MAREGRIALLHGPGNMDEAARVLTTLDERFPTRVVVDLAAADDAPRVDDAVRHLARHDVLVVLLDLSSELPREQGEFADRLALWLQTAYISGSAIIAVRVGGASMPLASYLPSDSADPGTIPEIELHGQTWDTDVTRLIDEIDRVIAKQPRSDSAPGELTATRGNSEDARQAAQPPASTPPGVSYRLWAVSTFADGAEYDIYDGITLGRAQDAGIRLDNSEVSRHHAVLSLKGDRLTIEDTESTNGTWVNDERIASRSPIHLSVGDVITLGTGDVQLRVENK